MLHSFFSVLHDTLAAVVIQSEILARRRNTFIAAGLIFFERTTRLYVPRQKRNK